MKILLFSALLMVSVSRPAYADTESAAVTASESERGKETALGIRDELQKIASTGETSDAQWSAIDTEIVAYQKEFGDMSSTQHNCVLLRKLQLLVAKNFPAPDRLKTLADRLSKDPDPGIAEEATAALASVQQVADLQSKPLDLQFTSVDGAEIDLEKMRGKVVLIDFWATWCPPCRFEVPNVVAAYQKYHAQGFEVVGISLDQDKDKLLSFTKEHSMTWPQYFDGQGWDNKISSRFGIRSIPAMWLVGKDGKLVTTDGRDNLDDQVGKLLQAP